MVVMDTAHRLFPRRYSTLPLLIIMAIKIITIRRTGAMAITTTDMGTTTTHPSAAAVISIPDTNR